MCGCAALSEVAKRFYGVSTRILEDNKETAIVKVFNYDYSQCYGKTLAILKDIKAYVYAKDAEKKLVAVYVSEEDTTPVGIFFTEEDKNKTRIEVSSPSTYARELISDKLFSRLEENINQ